MSVSLRFQAAIVAAAVFLFGCVSVNTPPPAVAAAHLPKGAHLEKVPKQQGSYERLTKGRVRIFARGEFVLDHEDDGNLYIVIYEPLEKIAPTFSGFAPISLFTGPIRDARGTWKLIDVGEGLPHAGQWRDHFAVGDILGDGSDQIVFGPARKSGGGPVAFRQQSDVWERVHLHVPAGSYDYGGVAIGDFDGDGRNDLALAMHLSGFVVLRATGNGEFTRIDAGLPSRRSRALFGSGHAALALPAAPYEAASLLLLQETAFPSAPQAEHAPALAEYRYSSGRFVARPIAANTTTGDSLVLAPASSTCRAKLAVASAAVGAPPVLESGESGTWTARRVETFPDPAAFIGAVALGDIDGDGCSDFAVAYSSRVDATWHSVIDVYLDRSSAWKRINLSDVARGARIVAMSVATFSRGTLLLTLDTDGALRAYDYTAGAAELVLEQAAPDWRRGCAGSDIHVLSNDATQGLRIAASFAGEPTMGQFDRCRGGGGIEAWRIEQGASQ